MAMNSTVSLEEARTRRFIAGSALSRMTARTNLAPVAAPSLEGLRINTAENERPLEAREVLQAAMAEVAARLPREARQPGHKVGARDTVTVDTVAYAGPTLLPDLSVEEWQFALENAPLPGLEAKLFGVPVGGSVLVKTLLPGDYAIETLRNMPVVLSVTVRAASYVVHPPSIDLESPEFLRSLGLPPSRDQFLASVAERLADERELSFERAESEAIIAQLRERAPVQIPDDAVDAVIGHDFNESQGRFLQRMGVSHGDLESVAGLWLENENIRAAVRTRLHTSLVMAAIAQAHKLNQYTAEDFNEYVDTLFGPHDLTRKVLEETRSNPQFALQLREQFIWVRTLRFVHEAALRNSANA
jgi:FKBP-type peptidyl-prolyl cis-trans isomerase (trigger factor)